MNIVKNILNKFSILYNKHFEIIHNKETNEIDITCNNSVTLNVKGNFFIKTDNGELGLFSENNIISIDSINSKLYLNSRASSYFNNDDEMKEYKELLNQKIKEKEEQQLKKYEEYKNEIKNEIISEIMELKNER